MSSAFAVSIEVDGRQAYMFETDKLKEILGASRILASTIDVADEEFDKVGANVFGPVSGEIRAWSTDRDALLTATWELGSWLHGRGIEHTVGLVAATEDDFCGSGDLGRVHQELGRRVAQRRQQKPGEDARPRSALFAQCGIHAGDFANHVTSERDDRRKLVGHRASRKLEKWARGQKAFYEELFAGTEFQGKSFKDISDAWDGGPPADQYIAYLCVDGDRTGRLLTRIPWNSDWQDGKTPWERNRCFAIEMDRRIKRAVGTAIAGALEDVGRGHEVDLPLLPQVAGGDDVWIVCRKGLALRLATDIVKLYQGLGADYPTMAAALEQARSTGVDDEKYDGNFYTISAGVAFAKAGYPAHAMVDAAESLLRSAKRLRRSRVESSPPREELGCVDWHWTESSRSEPVEHARDLDWSYVDTSRTPTRVVSLTTRPWTSTEASDFLAAHTHFAEIARRKREQLHQVLRLGQTLSELAWSRWYQSLSPNDLTALGSANDALPRECKLESLSTSPWQEIGESIRTPFLDLVALHDVFADVPTDEDRESSDTPGAKTNPLSLRG